jgi:hypothetical protein
VTLQLVAGGMVPLVHHYGNGSTSFSSLLIDASGEKVAFLVRVPKTGNIRTIRFRLNTTTTGQTLRAGIYTFDANGDPTTTAYGGMAVGTVAVANTDDNVEKVVTLATDAAATKGDYVAVVIEFDGTVGSLNIGYVALGTTFGLPCVSHLTAAWVRQLSSPVVALGYDDESYEPLFGCSPFTVGLGQTSYNAGTGTFDEHASKFTASVAGRIVGALVMMQVAAGADFEFLCYDGTTALATKAYDGDLFSNPANIRPVILEFDSPVTVAAGDVRRLAIRPTTANNVQVTEGTVGVAAAMAAAFGADFHASRRLNQGAWNDDLTTTVRFIFPIYDQFDDAAGGGGGLLTHPGMSGGMRG